MTVTIQSPYLDSPEALWLRGNLHTHTTRSDGRFPPQETVDAYVALGHDFLALSDHNVPADFTGLDPGEMLLLPACEVSAASSHVLALGTFARIEQGLDEQATIDAVRGGGGFAVLCHPGWQRHFNHYTYEALVELAGYAGIEIYNGSVEEDPGSPYALEKWDRLLTAGRTVRGLAVDDSHKAHQRGRGWCVVRAAERSAEAVLAALRAGSFYASTGVDIESISVEGSLLRVVAPEAEALAAVGDSGRRLAWTESPELAFDARECPGEHFRVECRGRAARMAWTQPFLLCGEEIERRRALLAAKPVLRVGRPDRAPELKGDLSDPAWNAAPVGDAFMRHADGGPPAVRTEVRCLLAAGRLFFGLSCEEPHMDRLRLAVTEDGNGSTYADDGVEIFLDTDLRARRYFHLMVNATGFVWTGQHGQRAELPREVRPRARAARSASGYSLEVAVPLAQMGVSPAPGERWGFNLARNRTHGPGSFTWSFTGGNNHLPECFGLLEF